MTQELCTHTTCTRPSRVRTRETTPPIPSLELDRARRSTTVSGARDSGLRGVAPPRVRTRERVPSRSRRRCEAKGHRARARVGPQRARAIARRDRALERGGGGRGGFHVDGFHVERAGGRVDGARVDVDGVGGDTAIVYRARAREHRARVARRPCSRAGAGGKRGRNVSRVISGGAIAR